MNETFTVTLEDNNDNTILFEFLCDTQLGIVENAITELHKFLKNCEKGRKHEQT